MKETARCLVETVRHDRIRTQGGSSPFLQTARDALLWKLDGVSEYDVRRPLTPTGTNLLGLIKHVAGVEVGYFGDTFGRRFTEPLPWLEADAEPNADMWATAEESRDQIVGFSHRASVHSDTTIDTLALDAIGAVGVREDNANMAPGDQAWWEDYRNRLEHVARRAGHD